MALAAGRGSRLEAAEYAKRWQGSTPEVAMILKAAVTAGTTTDSDWAAPLVIQVDKQKYENGAGAVVGGLVGGGLGSLVGGGAGKTAAIIVGAIGGGIVGNEMQKNQTELIWEIGIRYDDGSYGTITQTQSPGLRIGDRVRVTDTGLELLPRGR